MFCPRCGSSVKEDTKFCPRCGENLEAVQEVSPDVGKRRKTKKGIILFIIFIIFVALAGFVVRKIFDNDKSNKKAEDITNSYQTELENEEKTDEGDKDLNEVKTEVSVEEQVDTILASMNLKEKIFQMFLMTPEQLTGEQQITYVSNTMQEAIKEYPVGGLIFLSENIQNREQVIKMLSDTQGCSELGMFLCVDEEGGNRVIVGGNEAIGTTPFPNMMSIGSTGETEQAYEVGNVIGSELKELGFNVDFAPVADVAGDNAIIGDRAFSSEPMIAAEMVEAAIHGFSDSGIVCTLKHFPGYGNTVVDSDVRYILSDMTVDDLLARELIPFKRGIDAGAPMIMIGHIWLPEIIGADIPSSLSYDVVTDLLRGRLGFQGVCIMEPMPITALMDTYASDEVAVMAVQSGIDMLMVSDDFNEVYQGLVEAVAAGELSEKRIDESVRRILKLKIEKGIISLK